MVNMLMKEQKKQKLPVQKLEIGLFLKTKTLRDVNNNVISLFKIKKVKRIAYAIKNH